MWKSGGAGHINNFELRQPGRNRTNVWDYPGISAMGPGRLEELAMHPTVKPVAMVADAIKDCSSRGGLVLDPFCGSGTILIAAERTGRKARAIEIDPACRLCGGCPDTKKCRDLYVTCPTCVSLWSGNYALF